MSEIKVSIVVPTFRRPSVLRETLESLSNLNYPPRNYEVIVVDDGSNDETPEVVEPFREKISNLIYHYQENSGVATARNRGAKLASGEVLIFNDDDIVVEPNLIERHLANLDEFGKCVVNGHWEFPPTMTEYFDQTPFGRYRTATEVWVKAVNDKKQIAGNIYESQTVSACNCGVRREDFWQIGGYDEQFPFAGFEDHEFCLRAAKAGYRFVYDYGIKLWHNDHRINFEQFGERQRRGAITKVLLATKYPHEEAEHPMIVENNFRKPGEPVKRSAKKMVKSVLANPGVSEIVFTAIRLLESKWKTNVLLPRLYNVACGIYIFRGIRQGIERYGEPNLDINDR
jgi:GT2 family glycosyltransferase